MDMEPTRPALSALPTEILQSILSYTSDAITLRNLVNGDSALYRAFHGRRVPILQSVLYNEFGLGILPDALATYISSTLPRRPYVNDSPHRQVVVKHHEKQIARFLNELEDVIPTLPHDWTLPRSVALSKLRRDVECFATDYASDIGLINIATGHADQGGISLSETERDRVLRAFYRYELYCNLFRRSTHFEHIFWVKYAPWEYEQLASVYEYLVRIINPSFYDVAQHDLEWGYWRVKSRETPSRVFPLKSENPWRETILSRGLGCVRSIVTANSYNEYRHLMGSPAKETRFLEYHFSMPAKDHNCLIADLSDQALVELFGPSFTEEVDDGPLRAWGWAHEGHRSSDIYYQDDQYELRKQGYVMFDLERLERWGIFARPFEVPVIPGPEKRAIYQTYKLLNEQDQKSQEIRSDLYVNGATGWWAFGDHSFLTWLGWECEMEYNKKKRHQEKMKLISTKVDKKLLTGISSDRVEPETPQSNFGASSTLNGIPAADSDDIDMNLDADDDGDTVWDPIE